LGISHGAHQRSSREAAESQSPGLAAFFAAYPGKGGNNAVNPEGVASSNNDLRISNESPSQIDNSFLIAAGIFRGIPF
jgi:hypothetical protein